MSTQTTPVFYPGAPMYPSYDSPTTVHEQIYATVAGTAERTKQQAANDIARDILRAVDHNGSVNSHVTEISSAQLASAIERNGANGMSTTERVNSQLASAVERNGALNQSAIERTSGEARLTTVIADAANRQAQNDSTRDVLRNVDRVGAEAIGSTKDSFATLLGTVERNAGETRLAGAIANGVTDAAMRDVRYSILSDVNRVGNELTASGVQTFNVLNKAITDSAWEARTAMANGFQSVSEEHLRTKYDLFKGMDSHYTSLLLEQQKSTQFMASKADGHFAAGQLELQKVKEGLATQSAQQFAITQLELQKNFASAQLEAQKNREAIQKDLCDAKYEALKSQQYLTDKLSECCCSIKEKQDLIDRDRLRDNLNISRDKNAIYESIEFQQLFWGGRGGPYGGYGYGDRGEGHHGHHHGRR